MARGLAAFMTLASSPLLDRFGLRKRAERAAFHVSRTGISTTGAASRVFSAVNKFAAPQRLPRAPRTDLIDLTPTEDQRMLIEVVTEFAAEQVRPAAAAANDARRIPADVLSTAVELGITQLGVPETLGGFSEHRSPMTNALVAEALGHGDLGLAVAALAPAAVGTALGQWGDAEQQARYLPSFAGKNPPLAALALVEPHPLFDPFSPRSTAELTSDGYRLDGVKSLVPSGDRAELFLIGATVIADGERRGPALFLVESATAGITVRPEPAMGLRAAGTTRVTFDGVALSAAARLGTEEDNPYREAVRLSRLGWAALAVGTAQAVVDYVIPYVNDRVAFGEPISNRQGVAFTVADMATEVDGMRLVTYRAASRAEQGLDYAREVALARRLAGERGMAVGSDGVQLLGGHGFIKDHPVERWYRDLRAIGVMEGVVLL
jgi:alkylation response protein AidB-like acyl-CoA dehydrogenase